MMSKKSSCFRRYEQCVYRSPDVFGDLDCAVDLASCLKDILLSDTSGGGDAEGIRVRLIPTVEPWRRQYEVPDGYLETLPDERAAALREAITLVNAVNSMLTEKPSDPPEDE
ncbi:hypothetical protein FYK55_17035 [Roseiconus nitratireducens]|uniref:Uncharacterized protein n=1 Tax=Roseiconus nitratireducens TaxID=2605748 RepID=A0A5M6D348_9BACT|nr:hypothetical protein [Roseiconus nitratireducens]KAA5541901.1 hypothetical protein FYK55_17035 [Roseiconus nitratireducens]